MRILYFDCFSGISGDMILGALVDAGLPPESLLSELEKLGLDGYSVAFEAVTGAGSLAGTRARVAIEESGAARHLPEILGLIRSSALGDGVKDRACAIFQRLGEAEAAVHGIPVEKIHFHEVGALDAIILVKGRVRLILDSGETVIGPGDVVIQRATNHAWAVEGDEPALFVAVLIDRS